MRKPARGDLGLHSMSLIITAGWRAGFSLDCHRTVRSPSAAGNRRASGRWLAQQML